jgi:hypothetical protein
MWAAKLTQPLLRPKAVFDSDAFVSQTWPHTLITPSSAAHTSTYLSCAQSYPLRFSIFCEKQRIDFQLAHHITESQRVVLTLAQTILPHQSHVCHYSNPSVWIVVTLLLVSSLHRTFHFSLILHTDLKWLPLSFQYVRLLWIEEILLKKWRNFWMRWELIIFSSKFSFNSKEA